MSEEQLAALLAKLKDDAGLSEKLHAAADLDAAVALAKEAGFYVSKADLLKYQAQQTLELSDEELGCIRHPQKRVRGQKLRLWESPFFDPLSKAEMAQQLQKSLAVLN